jgi:DNA-binding YbaB/EbfC family protein
MSKTPNNERPGLGDLVKKAQEMQKTMKQIQEQIANMVITGKSGGGLVTAEVTGTHYVKRIVLDPSLMTEEKAIIEDLIAAAINDATDKIEKGTREKMGSLTGIKLPDGFGLPTDK